MPSRWEGLDDAWGTVYDQCCWGWTDPPDSEPEQKAVRAAMLTVVDLIVRSIREGDSDPYSNFDIIREHITGLPDDPAGHPIDVPAAFAVIMGDALVEDNAPDHV